MSEGASIIELRDASQHAVPVDARVVHLLHASTPTERKVLDQWLTARHDGPPAIEWLSLDDTSSVAQHITRALEAGDDPWYAPVGVAWLARAVDGQRRVRVRDAVMLTDPRQPRSWQQGRILRREPDRIRVIGGKPAPLSELLAHWRRVTGRDDADAGLLAPFVRRRALLALERAESRQLGDRYKVPRLVRDEILGQARFHGGIERLARELDEPEAELMERAAGYLDEMVATHSRFAIDMALAMARLFHDHAYKGSIRYDADSLDRIKALRERYPVAFLPSHRAYIDPIVLASVLHENGFPPVHRLGGINGAFWPIGPIGRRTGIIFIRRNVKDDLVYRFTLREYIGYLVEKRFSLEWYLEGGRTRTGKLRRPHMGLLAYVADAVRDGRSDDFFLVPVSIIYDELLDVEEYTRYAKGAIKASESIGWLLRYVRQQRHAYGQGHIHVGFGEPVSLRDALSSLAVADTTSSGAGRDGHTRVDLQKVAFEVAVRINRVTPITPTALVTLALLGADRAVTAEQLIVGIEPLLDYIEARGLPLTQIEPLRTTGGIRAALQPLLRHGGLTCFDEGPDAVYLIAPEQRTAAAYYRNSIIHFFLETAIAELAVLRAAAPDVSDPIEEVFEEAVCLRDLLKFEFFFPEKEEFRSEIAKALTTQDPEWERSVVQGPVEIDTLLRGWRPLCSHIVLLWLLDAYAVVAECLVRRGSAAVTDQKAFLDGCMAVGRQRLLQRRVNSAESVSMVLFENALELARNRGLVDESEADVERRRRVLKEEIHETTRRAEILRHHATRQVIEVLNAHSRRERP